MELQSQLKQVQEQGLGLAVISYDSREVLAAFSAQNGITFPLLSDVGSATIKQYGILNTVAEEAVGPNRENADVAADTRKYVSEVGASARAVGIAYPGTFVLDPDGKVTSRFFEDSYIERNTVSNILLTRSSTASPVAGTQISTEHLSLTSYPSESAVAPGSRFALVFDITPRPNMHVYAPGAIGYRVITLTIPSQPFIRPYAIQYPSSEIYVFEPLNERVPVYQKPFTLRQEITLEGNLQAQKAMSGQNTITITGTLDYQACDDKICFNPVSLPLSWTVGLKPIARPSRAR